MKHMMKKHHTGKSGEISAKPKIIRKVRRSCDKCDFSTFRKIILKQHKIKNHSRKSAFCIPCDECDYSAINHTGLIAHRRIHQDRSGGSQVESKQAHVPVAQDYPSKMLENNVEVLESPSNCQNFQCSQWSFSQLNSSLLKILPKSSSNEQNWCEFSTSNKLKLIKHKTTYHSHLFEESKTGAKTSVMVPVRVMKQDSVDECKPASVSGVNSTGEKVSTVSRQRWDLCENVDSSKSELKRSEKPFEIKFDTHLSFVNTQSSSAQSIQPSSTLSAQSTQPSNTLSTSSTQPSCALSAQSTQPSNTLSASSTQPSCALSAQSTQPSNTLSTSSTQPTCKQPSSTLSTERSQPSRTLFSPKTQSSQNALSTQPISLTQSTFSLCTPESQGDEESYEDRNEPRAVSCSQFKCNHCPLVFQEIKGLLSHIAQE